MRLSAEQAEVIRTAVREIYGEESRLRLFGSRVDDTRRGGDIDLLVRPDSSSAGYALMDKIQLHKPITAPDASRSILLESKLDLREEGSQTGVWEPV